MINIQNLVKDYSYRDPSLTWKTSIAKGLKREDNKAHIRALNEVFLDVEKGEIIGILGPNGAGKTTLLKVIAGFLAPDKGSVTVNGCDVMNRRHTVRVSCNFLRAGGWIIFDYKYPIHKLLRFWGVFMGLSRKEATGRVDEALRAVGLEEKRNDYPENLSAGLRQRLNLARCLLTPRPIYLLDEPTTNIDPHSANFIQNYVLNDLRKDDVTVVLATHNLWEAEMMCDNIAILNEGKVLMYGTASEIKSMVGEESVVLGLDGHRDDIIKELQGLNYIVDTKYEEEFVRAYGKDLRKHVPEITDICRKHTNLNYFDVQTPSLNETFIQLISQVQKKKTEKTTPSEDGTG